MLPFSRPIRVVRGSWAQPDSGQPCWQRALCSGLCSSVRRVQDWRGGPGTDAWTSLCLTFQISSSLAFLSGDTGCLCDSSSSGLVTLILFPSAGCTCCLSAHKVRVVLGSISSHRAVCECVRESRTAVRSALARSAFQNKVTSQCDILKALRSLIRGFSCLFIVSKQYTSVKLFVVAWYTVFSYVYAFESGVLAAFISSLPHPPSFLCQIFCIL